MLHQDGSRHEWLEGQPQLDLVVTMDDATSTVYSAFLVEEEGTGSSFHGLTETFAKKGLPSSLYTDRGSHYFTTPKAGGRVAKENLTQVGRALAQLGIEHIPSYSPQARGRSGSAGACRPGRRRVACGSSGCPDRCRGCTASRAPRTRLSDILCKRDLWVQHVVWRACNDDDPT
jgi:hypothetical protein